MEIRETTEADEPALRALHEAAFGPQAGRSVADLTIALLHDPTARPALSLVACDGRSPIGHVLFTSVRVSGCEVSARARILAPLAVQPEGQRRGTGSRLTIRALSLLAESGCDLVFVLGHPEYYPRFGFQPAGRLGFAAPYPIPSENANAWMVLGLPAGVIGHARGTVQCAESLMSPEHWRE